jgi:hypothetical protein
MAGTEHETASRFRTLRATVASGTAILFTGAGFALDARDRDGQPLPDSASMAREVWPLCFPDEEIDDSTLSDLFEVALRCSPKELAGYLERRLIVGPHPLPEYYRAWFTAPWHRLYTLNVDDLEDAAARQFGLQPVEVVHLNGKIGAPLEELTFSPLQYAARLVARERVYAQLARELHEHPFVFVGTTLDEAVMWQHIEGERRSRGDAAERPRSFLVTPTLPRARRAMLEALQIEWISATAAETASVLDRW